MFLWSTKFWQGDAKGLSSNQHNQEVLLLTAFGECWGSLNHCCQCLRCSALLCNFDRMGRCDEAGWKLFMKVLPTNDTRTGEPKVLLSASYIGVAKEYAFHLIYLRAKFLIVQNLLTVQQYPTVLSTSRKFADSLLDFFHRKSSLSVGWRDVLWKARAFGRHQATREGGPKFQVT